jgi:hypothetical protein
MAGIGAQGFGRVGGDAYDVERLVHEPAREHPRHLLGVVQHRRRDPVDVDRPQNDDEDRDGGADTGDLFGADP